MLVDDMDLVDGCARDIMRLMRNWARRGLDVIGRIWIGGGKVGRRMGLVIRAA